jgi:hypothetical protein
VATIIVLDTIIKVLNTGNVVNAPVNRIVVNKLITRILVYSAIKISANIPLLYSILKPETNSDSPSAKSNGVRLVSARFVINHKIVNGIIMSIIHDCCVCVMMFMSSSISIIKALSKRRNILTSYEIVCATPRKAPNKAYLELEHQPDINVAYTFILDTQRK